MSADLAKARQLAQARDYVNMLRDMLDRLSPEERVKMFDVVQEGYCPHCGEKQPEHGTCQCENEE